MLPPEDRPALQLKLVQVEQSLKKDSELRDLLSRPVHIPMFMTVLPNYSDDLTKMRRGSLYKSFIEAIIRREVYRLPRPYQQRYSSDQRFKFAELLALEMARSGETKSIRVSEIPERIIEPFRSLGAKAFRPPAVIWSLHAFWIGSRQISCLLATSHSSNFSSPFICYR